MYDPESNCNYCELQELGKSSDMYLIINELVAKEVDRRVVESVADIERIRSRNAEQEKNIQNLMDENRNLKREKTDMARKCESEKADMEKNCKQRVTEAQADALKTLFGDYKRGDTVYWIEDARLSVDCKKCGGKGKFDVEIDGEKMQAACLQCNGSGRKILENGKSVGSKRPSGIYATVNAKGEIYAVADLGEWDKRPLASLMSKEEAEARVSAHNDAVKSRYMEKELGRR